MIKTLACLTMLAVFSGAARADNPQQGKMKTCMADAKAKGLKGDEFAKFRSECLSADKAEEKPATQQDKMKACMAEAKTKGLKGDDFKKFRSECLSKKPTDTKS